MSKFGGLIQARRQQPELSTTQKSEKVELPVTEIPATRKAENAEPQSARVPPSKRPGRPKAKRSNPDYQQVTAYIRKDTYTAARKLLLDEEREFSELVEELVSEWVNAHQRRP